MSETVIQVENLGKRYRIGAPEDAHAPWWRRLGRMASAPVRYLSQTLRPATEAETLWALKDVSFEVKRGECLGLIGPNGAGKSTLLKILSRITEPTEGRARIKGRVGSLLEVGTGFHPELTGRENIYINGAVLGMSKTEVDRKFDEIVAFAEIERFIDTPVKRYSSGMYVRLAFAVAAHLEPEILLVDEVLAVGDAAFQKKCLGKMEDVAVRGRTVLFVSHNMEMVRKLCSRAILLGKGSLKSQSDTDQVIDEYLDAFHNIDPSVALPGPDSEDAPGGGTRLRLLAADGRPGATFRLNEPWLIELEFEIYRETPHVIAAAGFYVRGTIPLVTYWSQPKDLRPGKYRATFRCDLSLSSMHLTFGVGLSSNERTFYFVRDIGGADILDVSKDDQPFRAKGSAILLGNQDSEIVSLESL